MKKALAAAAIVLAWGSVSACGKVAASIAGAAAHHADDGIASGARAAASEEMEAAAKSAAHSADDATHGPKPAEETLEVPPENSALQFGKRIGEEAANELIEQGVTSALSDKEDQR